MNRRNFLKMLGLSPLVGILGYRKEPNTKYKCFVGGKPKAVILNDEFIHKLPISAPETKPQTFKFTKPEKWRRWAHLDHDYPDNT